MSKQENQKVIKSLSSIESHYQIIGDYDGRIIPLKDAASIIRPGKYSENNKVSFQHAQARLIAAAHNFVVLPDSVPTLLFMHQTKCPVADRLRRCSATIRLSISKILCEMFARTDFGRLRIGHPLTKTGGYRYWRWIEIAQAAETSPGEFAIFDEKLKKLVTTKKFNRVIEALTQCSDSTINANEKRGAHGLQAFAVEQQRELDSCQVNEYGEPVKKYRSLPAIKNWNKNFLLALRACSPEALDNAVSHSNKMNQKASKDFHDLPENKHILECLTLETHSYSAAFDVLRSDSKKALDAILDAQTGHHFTDHSNDHMYVQTPLIQIEEVNALHKKLPKRRPRQSRKLE